jgi:predicted Zn-dependent protease
MTRLERAAAYEFPQASAVAWEVHACKGCSENASALPGGKLLVSAEYIARLALTDDELAYMLAHEMGHVLAQHTREFASAARYFVDNGRARGYADIEHELGENLGVALRMQPISVQQELEADRIGFVLGAHAGFAPDAMLSLIGKLDTGEHPLVDTHPDVKRRRAQARGMLDAMRRLASQPLR